MPAIDKTDLQHILREVTRHRDMASLLRGRPGYQRWAASAAALERIAVAIGALVQEQGEDHGDSEQAAEADEVEQ